MKVEFLEKFSKDLDKLNKVKDKEAVVRIIELVKSAQSVDDIGGVKKLSGFKNAYRIRMGNYRIGVFLTEETVVFGRIAHRKDIYRVFP